MLKIINQTLLICKYYMCKTRNFAGLNFISLKNNILNTKQLQEKKPFTQTLLAGHLQRPNFILNFTIFFIYFIVSLIYFHCKIACTC